MTVRFGEIATVFEPTDDGEAVAKGGGTRVMEVLTMSPQPPKPAVAKPAAAKPPVPAKAPVKRAPVAQQQEKKGKGCGSSAAVLLLGMVGLVYWFLN